MRIFSPRDALRLSFIGEAGFVYGSRFGYYVVLAVERGQQLSSLWRFDRGSGRAVAITGPFTNPRAVRPSPGGDRLAFVADIAGTAQICIAPAMGSDIDVVTSLPQGVGGPPEWSPTGDVIAFSAPPYDRRQPDDPYRIARPTIRYEGIGTIDDALLDLFTVDLTTRSIRQLTKDDSLIQDPRWSPDGSRILFVASFPPDREWTARPSAHVMDVGSGARREVASNWGAVLSAEWSPDGERIVLCGKPAVGGVVDVHFQKNDLWTVAATGGTPVCCTKQLAAGIGNWLEFDHPNWSALRRTRLRVDHDRNVAYVSAQRGGDVGICRVPLHGRDEVEFVVSDPGRTCFLMDLDPIDGSLLFIGSTLLSPPELFVRDHIGESQITRLNRKVVHSTAHAQVHALTVTAHDGLALDAWALTPPGPGPFPTVLAIHGGPGDAYGNVFMIDHHLLVGAGFAVVFSNFRGSGGYGNDFHHALHGRWGELGEPDHIAAIDRAIELGIADPLRLGVFGLSHGGFATCWLLGRSSRFRAGVAENPAVDFSTLYATMDAPWWLPLELGARPDENPALYADLSALPHARRCSTPILFVVGEADLRCPPSQAEQYYRVLKSTGCVSEMVRLPGSRHVGSWEGPVAARAAQNDALVEWFRRYLLDVPVGVRQRQP